MTGFKRDRFPRFLKFEIGMPRKERRHLVGVLLRLVGTRRVNERSARCGQLRRLVENLRLKLHQRGKLLNRPVPPRIRPPPKDPRVAARCVDEDL